MTRGGSEIDIRILCEPGVQLASIAPFQDLASFSIQYSQSVASGSSGPLPVLRVTLVRDGRGPIVDGVGVLEPINFGTGDFSPSVVVLPAADDPAEEGGWQENERRAAWLKRHHEGGGMIAAIGSGVLALAETGLLESGPASIPPRYDRHIRKRFPGIRLAHAATVAENGRLITASEAVSVFAVAVIVARRVYSDGFGEAYRRRCGLREPDAPGDSILPVRSNLDLLVSEAKAWIVAHMTEDIRTEDVAAHFNVSARTLHRRFSRALGLSPAAYLRAVRLDAARSMLQRTQFSIEQIAYLIGYRDVSFFRELFRRSTGQSPRAFRMGKE